jgi:hypothetical protein
LRLPLIRPFRPEGVNLEAKVVGPDGQIVKGVTAMYPGIDAKLIDI